LILIGLRLTFFVPKKNRWIKRILREIIFPDYGLSNLIIVLYVGIYVQQNQETSLKDFLEENDCK